MKRHISVFLMILVFLSACAIPTISVFAEYDFDSMTLEEVKKLEKAAGDYYDEMTKVTSAADKEIENLISTEVGKYFNGTVSNPIFGYSIKRARNIYTLNDTVKVKDANNKSTKHNVEAEFLFNGVMAFTKLIVDGKTLISIEAEDVPAVEYLEVTAQKLIDDLDNNALAAKEKYLNQYVAVSGLLNVIDSSGDYISITPSKYTFSSIHCSIDSTDILNKVKNLSSYQKITVYGKITMVGEVLGYSMDIHDID